MNIAINAIEPCIDIPDCTTAEKDWCVTSDEEYLSMLLEYELYDWLSMKVIVQKNIKPYSSFKD